MLSVDRVTKGFRSRTGWVQAVDGVSFDLGPGEVLAFLGPNGAGKTTTIKMSAGLVTPDRGAIRVDGQDLVRNRTAVLGEIGSVLEGSRNIYWRMTALENLMYWGMMRGLAARTARERGLELLRRVGLEEKRDNTVQTLSRGMQQKVALATALVHRPRLLLLDEPTLGLDWQSGEDIKTLVRDLSGQGVAILLTTHQLDVAEELSDRIAIIRHGQLVLEGRTEAVLARFSRDAFRVTLGRPPDPGEAARLTALGFELDEAHPAEVLCMAPGVGGGGSGLAAVVGMLAGFEDLPVEAVARDRARLAGVFAEVVGPGRSEEGYGTGAPETRIPDLSLAVDGDPLDPATDGTGVRS